MPMLRDIELFVEVVNTKSFRLAADNLDMPASTLSRRISLLEQTIGLRLLNRTTRKVEVTEAGAAYYAKCAHLVQEASVAHEDLLSQVLRVRGTLRLSCTHDFASYHLAPALAQFMRLYPELQVELDLSSRRVDLIAENYDAALRLGHLPDSGLVARTIGHLQAGLYASAAYLKSAPPLQHPNDLAAHECIRISSKASASTWTLYPAEGGPAQQMKVQVQGRLRAGAMSIAQRLAIEGQGVSVIGEHIAQADWATGLLVRVLPQWRLAPAPVHLLTHSRLMPARVRLLGEFLAQHLAK